MIQIQSKLPNVAYQYGRRLLPRSGWATYNGVTVPISSKPLDGLFPLAASWEQAADRDGYESALVDGLRKHVSPGDSVVIVGAGLGVTATVAAQQGATVTAYEASSTRVEQARETARMNNVADRVDVQHAAVGPAENVNGSPEGAAHIPPGDLPACDILELDCEGAEKAILPALTEKPRRILVETHGCFGSPTAACRDRLTEMGYEIDSEQLAECELEAMCRERDVRVLNAVRE